MWHCVQYVCLLYKLSGRQHKEMCLHGCLRYHPEANRIELRSGAESGAKVLLPVVTRKLLLSSEAARSLYTLWHCVQQYGRF